MSKFPEKAEKDDDAHTQITCYHRSFFPKIRSVVNFFFTDGPFSIFVHYRPSR